jgi:outer membrane protein assembly factor BamE (lipoprotein component of BamABCDE complex)
MNICGSSENYAARQEFRHGLPLQFSHSTADIWGDQRGKRCRFGDRTIKITRQHRAELRIVTGETALVSADSAKKGAGHAFNLFADAQIPGAHLAQRPVKIGEHPVKKGLAKPIRQRALRFEPMKIQKGVQADEFEASVECVGHAVIGEEHRSTGLFDHTPISKLCSIASQTAPQERNQHLLMPSTAPLTPHGARLNLFTSELAGLRLTSTDGRFRNPMAEYQAVSSRRMVALLGLVFGGAAVASCSPSIEQRGHLPTAEKIAEIRAGSTTKDEVTKILGTPSSVSVFNNDKSWYYISRRTAQTAFFQPDVLDQQVYIVSFDDQDVVKTVDHKVLEDGKEITPVARATPAPGRELSFLEQVIGNLGKFNSAGGASSSGGGGGRGPGPNPQDNR